MKSLNVNDREENTGTTGYRLSSVLCAVQLKDLMGRVGAAQIQNLPISLRKEVGK